MTGRGLLQKQFSKIFCQNICSNIAINVNFHLTLGMSMDAIDAICEIWKESASCLQIRNHKKMLTICDKLSSLMSRARNTLCDETNSVCYYSFNNDF